MKKIQSFLEAMSYAETQKGGGVDRRPVPFVTISRQSGAGGHSLAKILVQVMGKERNAKLFRGWQMFDRELCEKLLEDRKLRVSMDELVSEEYHSQVEEAILGLLAGRTPQEVVIKRLFETVRTLASVGKVIVVGRAGSLVTRDLRGGVHIRLVAPEASRVKSMMKLWKRDEKETRRIVRKQDRDRARLVKRYFQADIDDPFLYDAVWNADSTPLEAIAEATVALIKHRAR